MEMRLEVVPLPVVDVDISKAFYVDQVGSSSITTSNRATGCVLFN